LELPRVRKELMKTGAAVFVKTNLSRLFLLLILLSAFSVRVYGIKFGLPYLYHIDEHALVNRALRMLITGDFNPHWFHWPSLYFYVQAGVYLIHYLWGVSQGLYISLAEAPQAGFYLWGRFTTAAIGTATVYLVYQIGKEMFNQRVGLLAALLLSFSFLHAEHSHYITPEVPMTFWVALSFLYACRMFQRGETKDYILASLFAGLAFATKYNGFLIFFPVVVAHLLNSWGKTFFNSKLFLSFFFFALGMFLGAPYIFLDVPGFLDPNIGIVYDIRHYSVLGHPGAEKANNWLFYLKDLSQGVGTVVFGLAAMGLALILIKERKKGAFLSLFPVVYFAAISSLKVVFGRNLIPVVLFTSIFAGYLVDDVLTRLKTRYGKFRKAENVALALVLVLALTIPAKNILQWDWQISQKDTRTKAAEWVYRNIPLGSKIALQSYTPQLKGNYLGVIEPFGPAPDHNLKWYQQESIQYAIFSSNMYDRFLNDRSLDEKETRRYEELFSLLTSGGFLLREFNPSDLTPGPTIKIFKIPPSDFFSSGVREISDLFHRFSRDGTVFLDFRSPDLQPLLMEGWSRPEPGGTWALGDQSLLFVDLEKERPCRVGLKVKPVWWEKKQQTVRISVNDIFIAQLSLDKAEFEYFELNLPSDLARDGLDFLKFEYAYSSVPKESGINLDERRLAVLFEYVLFEELNGESRMSKFCFK
jgi:4-amino-4-deoxy-L-arabinose transferase-like glycosyltransferase